MAIGPSSIGRISFNMRSISLLDSLTRANRDLFFSQSRLSAARRLLVPSDDPTDASAAVVLAQELERRDRMLTNVGYAENFVSSTEAAINEISDLLIEGRGLALGNIDSFVSQLERNAAATVIDSMIRELVNVGNRQYLDVELFAGRRVDTTPFSEVFGGVLYEGDSGGLNVRIDALQEVAFNLTGDDLYGALSSEIVGFADLNPELTPDTKLSDLNGATGQGVRPGVIRITDSAGPASYTVDLTAAHTVQDVIDLIAAQTGGAITASVTGGTFIVSGSGNLTITEIVGGTLATDLGILQTTPIASPITGQDTDPRLTLTTPLSSLLDGAGLALGSVSITNGSLSATVDLSGASTIEDVLNALNNAGVAVQARINDAGSGIDVANKLSGSDLRIGEDGGTTATDLGIRSYYGGTTLASLNHGRGVDIVAGRPDLLITDSSGATYLINLDGAATIQDAVDAINAVTGAAVTASLTSTGNGIRLLEGAPGSGQLSVTRPALADSPSFAADDLGFTDGAATVVSSGEIVSGDVNGIQPAGVFSTLIRLRDALRAGDTAEISVAANELETLIEQVNENRGIVGTTSASLSRRVEGIEDEVLAARSRLSEIEDLDYAAAITEFTQLQTALEATLLTGSRLLSLSFLDFLR